MAFASKNGGAPNYDSGPMQQFDKSVCALLGIRFFIDFFTNTSSGRVQAVVPRLVLARGLGNQARRAGLCSFLAAMRPPPSGMAIGGFGARQQYLPRQSLRKRREVCEKSVGATDFAE